jgi:hypothetical protein
LAIAITSCTRLLACDRRYLEIPFFAPVPAFETALRAARFCVTAGHLGLIGRTVNLPDFLLIECPLLAESGHSG